MLLFPFPERSRIAWFLTLGQHFEVLLELVESSSLAKESSQLVQVFEGQHGNAFFLSRAQENAAYLWLQAEENASFFFSSARGLSLFTAFSPSVDEWTRNHCGGQP